MEHPIVRDMRECCHNAVPDGDWVQEGWGFVLKQDGHSIRVNTAGRAVSFIQVSVTPFNHERYAATPFFRELSSGGTVAAYDDLGHRNPPPYYGNGNFWLRDALQQALEYIGRQRVAF